MRDEVGHCSQKLRLADSGPAAEADTLTPPHQKGEGAFVKKGQVLDGQVATVHFTGGKLIVNVEPRPSLLVTVISPP